MQCGTAIALFGVVTTDVSREVAEQSREKKWRGVGFVRELFLGNFRFDVIENLKFEEPDRPEFLAFMKELRSFLIHRVDPVAIDVTGEYPEDVLKGLRELGAFGLKIPRAYGGLGMNHREYVRVMALLGSHDANVTALLSAHQAIGVPQPIQLFGTEEQKQKYLPRCAKGAISAFALTEPGVGSDPAKVGTTAQLSGTARSTCSTGTSCGARTAPWRNSSWSWPRTRKRSASTRSWWRWTRRGSKS